MRSKSPFSLIERQEIQSLLERGTKMRTIQEIFKGRRSRSSIAAEISRGIINEKYDAVKSHERSIRLRQKPKRRAIYEEWWENNTAPEGPIRTHLEDEEKWKIEEWNTNKVGFSEIARRLGRGGALITNEIKRNGGLNYSAQLSIDRKRRGMVEIKELTAKEIDRLKEAFRRGFSFTRLRGFVGCSKDRIKNYLAKHPEIGANLKENTVSFEERLAQLENQVLLLTNFMKNWNGIKSIHDDSAEELRLKMSKYT